MAVWLTNLISPFLTGKYSAICEEDMKCLMKYVICHLHENNAKQFVGVTESNSTKKPHMCTLQVRSLLWQVHTNLNSKEYLCYKELNFYKSNLHVHCAITKKNTLVVCLFSNGHLVCIVLLYWQRIGSRLVQ